MGVKYAGALATLGQAHAWKGGGGEDFLRGPDMIGDLEHVSVNVVVIHDYIPYSRLCTASLYICSQNVPFQVSYSQKFHGVQKCHALINHDKILQLNKN